MLLLHCLSDMTSLCLTFRCLKLLIHAAGAKKWTYLVAPFEIRVFHERPISELSLEEIVNVLLHQRLEHDVQLREVGRGNVVSVIGVS